MIALFYKLKDTQQGRVSLLALFLIAVTPFVTHYYLTRRSASEFDFFVKSFHTRSALENSDHALYRIDELKRNVDELERLKLSLKNELRELEGKRHSLLRDIQEYSNNIVEIQNKATRVRTEVQKRQQELEDLRLAKEGINDCPELPLLKPSKHLLPQLTPKLETYPSTSFQETKSCTLSSCFNFQKCSFLDDFTAYIYNPDKINKITLPTERATESEIYSLLKSMPYSKNVTLPVACIYIVIIGPSAQNNNFAAKDFENALYHLPFWQGDGHNHLLINFAGDYILQGVNIGRAMLVQTTFGKHTPYRKNFDILIPPLVSLVKSGAPWSHSEPQLPAKRKYLLSFEGNYRHTSKRQSRAGFISIKDLKELSLEAEDLYIQLSCHVDDMFSKSRGWRLCRTCTSRAEILKKSTYILILQSEDTDDQTMSTMRFIEALQYGAIPVVLTDNIILPFEDMINWKRASVMLHNAQLPQAHFILRTILVNDMLDIRRQGRFLWETYLSTTNAVLATTLATIRTRLSLPAKPVSGVNYSSVFNEENQPVFSATNLDTLVEHRLKSPTFYRNFTSNNVYATQTWNTYPGALVSFPSEPFVPMVPSSAAFLNSSLGFQPLGKGAGGAGVEFQKALGGNYPVEQFTIVMLTYERELVLMEALERLAGLQYLNKVVVVWNSPQDPSPDLKWPAIGVPIDVLRPEKNSLNNRFLPHDQIETDAILSMDDDAHLRHDEILFGFRVWREARDRIVGFPGRFHAWDLNFGGWLYNSNYSCELSMVLTGAAFFHKYYAYLYSLVMPEAIRNKVDEYTNCEDIAMNFLVSHVTRKPPIKVTSRWTFRCPGCPQTLSQDETHFNERHQCINFFVKVYGYMPLLRTQFRADSVLFKTRLPHDKSKCFTYI